MPFFCVECSEKMEISEFDSSFILFLALSPFRCTIEKVLGFRAENVFPLQKKM